MRGLVWLWLRHGTLPGLQSAIHTSGAAVPFELERLSNTPARLEEASSRTPDLSRAKSCVSQQWEDGHSDRTRGLVKLRLRCGTPLGVPYALRASGAAVPFELERLSNTRARLEAASSRTPDLSRARPCASQQWEEAHSDRSRGLVRIWLRHGTLLGVLYTICASDAAVPFVLERLSNTPACLQEASCASSGKTLTPIARVAW